MSRSQTSTEYLIILAVVIIIALIVVGVLGGIPGIGGGAGESASRAALAAQTIGITGYSITDYDTTITVRNNNKDAARINSMSIGGQKCGFVSNVRLAPGETRQIDCPNVYELEQSRAEYAIVINWTDMKTQTNFSQSDPSLKIASEVGSEYLGVLDNTAGFSFVSKGCWDTSGSEPYPICTCYDLNKTRTDYTANYTLKNNIDFDRCMEYFGDAGWTTGSGWEPIGGDTDGDGDYSGTFDGANHHVGGLFIDHSGNNDIGLFGDASTTTTVIKNIGVSGSVSGGYYVGGLVGYAYYATIDNSYFTGSVSGDTAVGGLMGLSAASVTDSYSSATVVGTGLEVGGLAGDGNFAVISNSYATGTVSGSDWVGGLLGDGWNSFITNCYATGDVSGTSGSTGGLIGNADGAVVSGSHATGDVTNSGDPTGGLLGYGRYADVENSYATGAVSCAGTEYCGGLVGDPSSGVISLTLTDTNTWVNHTDDTATGCVGQSGTLTGTSAANCSP